MTTSIPEARGQRPQLGLPLLLAARRLLRRGRAQPPRRDRHDGRLPALHRRRSARGRRATARRCSRCTRSTASRRSTETRRARAARLPRHGAGARRQRRLPAGAARRLRLGDPRRHARVLRRAAGRSTATPRSSTASNRWAAAPSPCTTSPTPACGSCAARTRVHTFSTRHVLGGVRPARADRRPARARRRAPRPGARRRRRSSASSQERCWSEARQAYVATADGDELDASLLLLADLGFVDGADPRFASTLLAVERRAAARRLPVPLRRAGRLRRSRRTPSSSARSGT